MLRPWLGTLSLVLSLPSFCGLSPRTQLLIFVSGSASANPTQDEPKPFVGDSLVPLLMLLPQVGICLVARHEAWASQCLGCWPPLL